MSLVGKKMISLRRLFPPPLGPGPDPALDVSNLRVSYGSAPAVEGVTLRIGPGQIIGMLGANGAGKTTLLKGIEGLVRPSGGAVHWGLADITGRRPDEILSAGIALVPEGRRIFRRQTVLENLLLGATTRSSAASIRNDLEWVMDRFPVLREKKDQMGAEMSGGQQQMLAIARALMSAPRLLLLDEPSLGLAPKPLDQLTDLIQAINVERGVSFLIVEQVSAMVLELASSVHILRGGRVVWTSEVPHTGIADALREAYLGA